MTKDYPKPDFTLATLDANTSLAQMCKLVGPVKSVLDVGCATGYLGKLLSELGCTTSGIEINPEAADVARQFYAGVEVADIERTSLDEVVGDRRFDAVIFGDVLEHLRDPVSTLEQAGRILSSDGVVIASIPNVAHGAVRLALLLGHFNYQQEGILDDTHLRFFTLKTVEELFWQAGFAIEVIERVELGIFEKSPLLPQISTANFSPELIEEVQADPEARTLQFIVRAGPVSRPKFYRLSSEKMVDLQQRIASATMQVAGLERTVETLAAENSVLRDAKNVLEAELAATAAQTRVAEYRALAHSAIEELERERAARSVDDSARRKAEVECDRLRALLRDRDGEPAS